MSRVKKINFFLGEVHCKKKPNQSEDLFFPIYISLSLEKPDLCQVKLKKLFIVNKV